MRVLELYCGIGGAAAALGTGAEIVAAVDVNRVALSVYSHNFPHPVVPAAVESIPVQRLRRWDADLWWTSPPCQPFTRRGLSRDVDDRRAATLLAMLERLAEVRPRFLAFENVPPFCGSRGHEQLLATLERAGYREVHERILCPTDFGVPNRRRRYYLVAARDRLRPLPPPQRKEKVLRHYIDADPSPELTVEADVLERYRGALHVVRADDPAAVTNCFTAAYGRSPVRSGSYLAGDATARRFSPREILRLLGFPAGYQLPPELALRKAWKLAGDSLAIAPVRFVLSAISELGTGA